MIYVNARAIVEREQNGGEIVIQTRYKPHEGSQVIELPGGQVEPFESLLAALQREVMEETGLVVTHIEGVDTRLVETGGMSEVECLRPFAVYQTLRGPVDSMGVYFRCQAEGTLLAKGDDSEGGRWIGLATLAAWIKQEPSAFSWVDVVGMRYYLRDKGLEV